MPSNSDLPLLLKILLGPHGCPVGRCPASIPSPRSWKVVTSLDLQAQGFSSTVLPDGSFLPGSTAFSLNPPRSRRTSGLGGGSTGNTTETACTANWKASFSYHYFSRGVLFHIISDGTGGLVKVYLVRTVRFPCVEGVPFHARPEVFRVRIQAQDYGHGVFT